MKIMSADSARELTKQGLTEKFIGRRVEVIAAITDTASNGYDTVSVNRCLVDDGLYQELLNLGYNLKRGALGDMLFIRWDKQ